MKTQLGNSSSVWITRHSILIWIGIGLNVLMVVPLFFFPQQTLAFFGIPYLPETIWPRMAAMRGTLSAEPARSSRGALEPPRCRSSRN